jgi:hypothetical protein
MRLRTNEYICACSTVSDVAISADVHISYCFEHDQDKHDVQIQDGRKKAEEWVNQPIST